MKKLILIAGLTAALSAPAFATTNLIVNGDFTQPTLVVPWGQCDSCITGWTNANDMVEIGYSWVYGLTKIGSGVNLEANANTWGNVSQTVTGLTKGAAYNLTFEYGGRAIGGVQSLDVSFGGKTLTTDAQFLHHRRQLDFRSAPIQIERHQRRAFLRQRNQHGFAHCRSGSLHLGNDACRLRQSRLRRLSPPEDHSSLN
jgi:hypothetical protein